MPVKAIGFPGRYLQGPGAIRELGSLLREFGSRLPLVVADDIVRQAAGRELDEALASAGITARHARFPGECTAAVIGGLAEEAASSGIDMVIGFGGGKTIDTAKGVAKALGCRLFIVPSIASNDSPTSRLIVLYNEQHMVAGVETMVRNPDVVLVDTAIIARAPARFFIAGLGDALSKKFEAAQCHLAGGKNFFGTESLSTARLLADRCHDTILEFGLDAVAQVQVHGTPNEAVERCVEASVLLSGLGFESGGLSLSHALTRGFTAHAQLSRFLHGELVGFGTIVQLIAEDRSAAEVRKHARFCHSLGLPVRFADMDVAHISDVELADIAQKTCAAPYIGNLQPAADAERIVDCLQRADRLGNSLMQ
ncbi:glycerol dehydrogenase [Noviherbaspirillum cavernae]|uniref:Glycerol dehydrogenase n=1 Tax=Noviherbaspirillum cavernae TaxID=2320862 RepID=A0A418WYZ3_9BURK|nr:glycerol dehydrogenase [Noviherbaspirillum cavernae]RJG05436.1 glycerol dehydrogenase [Noviherbaspirillum cavernae]